MIPETIVLQSAGSLSVAVLSLIMVIFQMIIFLRKPRFIWYGWSAAISFSSLLYAIGIFLEYNSAPGPVNRFAGLLEYTAIIFLVHCLYGFTFVYLGMQGKRYHIVAGLFHGLVLILLWSTDLIVADRFAARNFIALAKPYLEPDLGPLGPLFVFYAAGASILAILLWIRRKGPAPRYRGAYLAGMVFWIALGIHDGAASLGVPTFQYVMEYGFLGFSLVVLWVVLNSFMDSAAEDKYRVITEFANDAILIFQDGKAVFGNPACTTLVGRPVMDSAAEDILDVIDPKDRQKLMRHYDASIDSIDLPVGFMARIRRAGGEEEAIVEIRASAIRYRNRPAVLAVVRDVTERVREEKALRESEEKLARLRKMESLGLLAGGVAHDLNNVLAGIVSYPDLILLELPEESGLRRPLQTIRESGQRAAAIVQDLLTIARGAAIPKEPFNLNDVIRAYLNSPEYHKLLQYHPSVTVKAESDPNLLNIRGSSIHVRKAVMNLVSNASEAIEGSGEVLVYTMNRYVDRPLKGYDEVTVGEYVVLGVTDNGPGISSDDLKRIFEPFFTKKIMGRSGTGLGLTLVWNIVQDHEGYIDVISNETGTRFELYFPVTREAVADRQSPVPLENLHGHGETILVIDDVESQREISCRMLEKLGYKTNAVPGGEAAVEYLKEHRVDLLVLDMIMDPGIDGRETYRRIKQIHPEQKAVIVSGFAETEPVKETLRMGAGRYIRKPLMLEDLGLAVKEELKKG